MQVYSGSVMAKRQKVPEESLRSFLEARLRRMIDEYDRCAFPSLRGIVGRPRQEEDDLMLQTPDLQNEVVLNRLSPLVAVT
jgi:hypothetical protein